MDASPAQDRSAGLRLLRRVGLPFALAVLAGVATISYVRVQQFRNDVEWRGHTHDVLEHIERMQTALLGADSLRHAYRLSRDPGDLEEIERRVATGKQEFVAVEGLTRDNLSQQERLRALRPVIAERIDVLHDGLDLPSSTRGAEKSNARGSLMVRTWASS